MSRYLSDPPVEHSEDRPPTGIVLVNLGTPEAPTPTAVKTYLREFLSDPRVVEVPPLLWKLILHGIVLNVRPKQSAAKYAAIWRREGSPLKLNTERQMLLLRNKLGEKWGADQLTLRYAMRYGRPSLADVLDDFKGEGCERIVIVPLYPQYAASTTASTFDAVTAWCAKQRNVPALRFVKHFYEHPAYIGALANSIREYWDKHGLPDKLVMSFHGLPRYTRDKGDPYYMQCQRTAELLAADLQLNPSQWVLSFQSRFGRTEWLRPYTSETIAALGERRSTPRVDVVCPGFVSDCLETLEEIALEAKAIFLQAGGREFHAIPCLNEREDWIAALAQIVEAQLGGWAEARPAVVRSLNAIR